VVRGSTVVPVLKVREANQPSAVSFTKVTRKGQITIPEEIRRINRISRGDIMLVGSTDGTVMLRKLALPSWSELFEYGEEFAKRKRLTREQILNAVREIRRGR